MELIVSVRNFIIPYYFQVIITSEDNRAVEGKGIGRKLIDRLYQTYSLELGSKKFAYDGEKALYTVGPLPQNKFEFTVVLEDSYAKQYVLLFFCRSWFESSFLLSLIFAFQPALYSSCVLVKMGVPMGLRNDQDVLFSQELSRLR